MQLHQVQEDVMNSCHLLGAALLAGGFIAHFCLQHTLFLSPSFPTTAALPEVVPSIQLCWQMDPVNALICFRQS